MGQDREKMGCRTTRSMGLALAGLGTSNKMEHKGETEASVQWQFSQQ